MATRHLPTHQSRVYHSSDREPSLEQASSTAISHSHSLIDHQVKATSHLTYLGTWVDMTTKHDFPRQFQPSKVTDRT